MKVEFKDSVKGRSPIKTTRIIPVPLPLREQTQWNLDNAVKMGILDIWLVQDIYVFISSFYYRYYNQINWHGRILLMSQFLIHSIELLFFNIMLAN